VPGAGVLPLAVASLPACQPPSNEARQITKRCPRPLGALLPGSAAVALNVMVIVQEACTETVVPQCELGAEAPPALLTG